MLLKIRCEYCDTEELEETNCDATFYCPTCDDEVTIHECEINVVKRGGGDKATIIEGGNDNSICGLCMFNRSRS